jgi:hypothetical protein
VLFRALNEMKKKHAYIGLVETQSNTRNGELLFSLTSTCELVWMGHVILEASNDGTT